MRKNTQVIETIETNCPKGTVLEVEVYYSKGGMNYFSGSVNRRGIYIGVTPVNIEKSTSGFTMRSITLFSGIKRLIVELARITDKTFATTVAGITTDSYQDLVNHVLNESKLERKVNTTAAVA